MTEYTKLNSEDSSNYGINSFLTNNMPFGKKSFLPPTQKTQESDKLEILDFGYKNNSSNKNSYSPSISLSFSNRAEENNIINRARRGNMKMYLYTEKNGPLIVLGPEWPSSLLVLILLIIFDIYYFYRVTLDPGMRSYGMLISFLHVVFYIICFLKNPGIPPKELWIENYFKNKNNEFDKKYSIRICKDCKIIIESSENIVHCKTCNVCVKGMSHHSFWIGKCVGYRNKCYYNCFTIMTVIFVFFLVFSFFTAAFYKRKNLNS